VSMKLDRLTESAVRRAESDGKAAGWHALCSAGYLPAEIAVFSSYAADIRTVVRAHAEKHGLAIPASCARSREPREQRPVLDWREAFRATVLRTGLQLNLSQPMLQYLCATADAVMWDRFGQNLLGAPDNWIATEQSLTKRGLIQRLPPKAIEVRGRMGAVCELTEAGKCVVALLKSVGVFVEADQAIEKRVAGGRR
jgi:hypothetical protein